MISARTVIKVNFMLGMILMGAVSQRPRELTGLDDHRERCLRYLNLEVEALCISGHQEEGMMEPTHKHKWIADGSA
eukprot:657686-Amphidinium_carterae.1